MKPTIWQKMDGVARNMTPFGVTLVLVLVGVVPLHVPGLASVAPLLALIAVYHWSVWRPDLLPPYLVFPIGLLHDALSGAPIGTAALVFLAVHGVVVSQRRFLVGKPFAVAWLGFAVIAAGATAATWILVSGFHLTVVEPRAALYQYLVSVGSFPPVAWLLLRWQQAVLRPD